jgi:hypothetical protein
MPMRVPSARAPESRIVLASLYPLGRVSSTALLLTAWSVRHRRKLTAVALARLFEWTLPVS